LHHCETTTIDPAPLAVENQHQQSAREWLYNAKRDLETVELLLDAEHYHDIIGVHLHSALTKIFIAVLAFHEEDIHKTHELNELREMVRPYFALEDLTLVELLDQATGYYYGKFERCDSALLDRTLINTINRLANVLFEDISKLLGIKWRKLCGM
jgi:HEPN domain-containing protein